MYGIVTYIDPMLDPNVGNCSTMFHRLSLIVWVMTPKQFFAFKSTQCLRTQSSCKTLAAYVDR